MKNLDTLKEKKNEISQRLQEAMQSNDKAAFQAAFVEFTDCLQEATMLEARGLIQSNDQAILAGRGARSLTSDETKYYQSVIDAMRSPNPKQALSGLDNVLPKTIIDMVFDDLTTEHPLLNAIDFQNTGALVEIIMSNNSGVATWSVLCDEIKEELSGAFTMIDLTLKKLSAFIPVCKAMLDLGPSWLDRYVRALLAEALAVGLEDAIADGDGDDKPIGMTRALTGAVDGVYPRKQAIVIDNLDTVTLGGILATLAQGPNGKIRAVENVIMVVNPVDYFTRVFPATTIQATDGTYVNNALAYPMTVIQSVGIPQGYAVFGLGKRYFFGLGTSKGGKLEYSDEYRFLEDERVYAIKLYGNGMPKDENAFVLADISGVQPAVLKVEVTNIADLPEV